MFLLATRSDAEVAHPELCGHVVVVSPSVAASEAVPLADIAISLPPPGSHDQSSDLFHERCLSAMEAASDLWASRKKLDEYVEASLRTEHVHQTCSHQVGWHSKLPICSALVLGCTMLA